jgi:hypothetical protein
MTRAAGTLNVGIRWDSEMGEFQLRCPDCATDHGPRYWPLTADFWEPQWGMTRCRACWNERKARRNRARWRSDPAYRAQRLEENREQRQARQRFAYRERWAALVADAERHAAYLERRRVASAAWRARQRELVAA